MLFSSILFVFTFLPITLLLYFVAPKKVKNIVILLCSLVFYAWGEPVYICLMLFSIGFNYLSGIDIARKKNEPELAKRSLIITVVVNILILGFFKYYGFVIDNINALLPINIPYYELALPIGISFYTFQTLSYIIDVYKDKVEVQINLLDFGLYVTMFPQLIAGPIVQYADIQNQLKNRKESVEKFGQGTMFFIRGLAKKVLLANTIGVVFTTVSALEGSELSVLTAWLGCAAYTFQIYFDFSGYSDMAIGLGKMFGFEFLKNFDYPYISKSITEFWRRWHISLGSWFREYVYIPLGGNRAGIKRHIYNILIVWILTGLWHGASWNFVAWGLYYGLILLAEKFVFAPLLERLPSVVQHVYSVLLIMVGWVLFFSNSLKEAITYLGVMFGAGAHKLADERFVYLLKTNWILWITLIMCSTPLVFTVYQGEITKGKRVKIWANTVVYAVLLLLCVAYLVTETYNPFLYFRF